MNCTICGFDNPADGRFCKKCGAALVAPVGTIPGMAPVHAAATAAATATAGIDAPTPPPPGGLPKPYIVIAVIAVVILLGAWAAWRSIGGETQSAAEAPATTTLPDTESKPEAAPASTEPAAPSPATGEPASGADNKPAEGAAATEAPAAPVIIPPPETMKPAPKPAPKARPRPQPAPHPAPAAPAAVPEPRVVPAPAPAAKAALRPDRWAQMASEMTACGRGNFFEKLVCEQKVRINYCDGYWGKVPQCPTGPAPTTGG